MLLFTAGVVVSLIQTVSAAPGLITEDSLAFTFPLPDNKCVFLLFSTEGDVTGVSVQRRQVRSPDGALLPLDAVNPVLEATTVTPRGVQVTLILDPKFFVTPGEYRVSLFFQGGTGTPNLASTVVINRPAADVNVDEIKDQTVSLTRWLPGMSAGSEFLLHVRETTGKVSINDLKLTGDSLYIKDSKELAPGEVTITPAVPAPSVAPGEVQTFKINISNVKYTGAYTTRLWLSSPSFSGGKAIPVKVNVTDFVLLPLLAITLGVVGAYLIRQLQAVATPRNQNALELIELQDEIKRFGQLVKKPASVETIQRLLTRLRRAIENNEIGNFAAVRDELTKLRTEFDEFRKIQVEIESEVQKELSTLTRQVETLEKSSSLTPDEMLDLKNKLGDIGRLCLIGMVEDAQMKIDDVKHLLKTLRTGKLVSYFSDLKLQLATLTLTAPAKEKSDKLEAEIQALLDGDELDKVHARLEQLKQFIVEQRRAAARFGRESARTGAAAAAVREVPDVVQPPTTFTHIEISTAPANRIAGDAISFNIVDVEKIIQPTDELRWCFGDIGSFEPLGIDTSHSYLESGRYQVQVDVVRKDKLVRSLVEIITILPGQVETARAAIRRDMVRNDLVLSGIALVLAIIGGVAILYSGTLFGSVVDYVMAILWGFGLDNSIKGFASVLSRITPKP